MKRMTAWATLAFGSSLAAQSTDAPETVVASSSVQATVHVPAFILPPSSYLSAQAQATLARQLAQAGPDFGNDIVAARAFYQRYNDDRLAEMRQVFRTNERRAEIAGVTTYTVTPAAGVSPRNRDRVLISVHGGAFQWGSGSGALVEAIPIAATMGIAVVAIDYRLAPEHRYPAASEDVAAVYRTLLKRYRPENIGIYGCSAGGIISAQSVAWFAAHKLPRPGALGTFCGTGAPYGGDSPYLAGPITGGTSNTLPALPDTLPTPYMAGVPSTDLQAYPAQSDIPLQAFPPTLALAGGRDFAVSALTAQHRRLTALGVPSELYLFDGLGHAFFVWPQMPESREAYGLISRFFEKHLGRSHKSSDK